MLYSSLGAKIKNITEQGIFENIIAFCVTKQTVQARTKELHRIRQKPQVQGQAMLTYTNLIYQTELNYSEPVILGLFINRVNDMKLQQDLLA
jgi:hypothetical protein